MAAIRVALVGCGAIAKHHLRALQLSKYATEVTAVIDVDRKTAEAFANQLPLGTQQCKVFESIDEALEWKGFEAVILMVPHHLHEPYAIRCMEAGLHVFLEKPLSHTVRSCINVLEAAKRAKGVFMVGENSPHWPEVAKASQLLKEGTIGETYFAQANYWESIGRDMFNLEDATRRHISHWRYDPVKAGGGVLMDGATHWIRPLRTWFGDITEVVGVVGHPYAPSKGESLVRALFKFKNGKTAALHCNYMDIPMTPLPFFQIFGTKGEISIAGSFNGGLSVRTHAHPEAEEYGSLGGYTGAFPPQMETFLRAIVEGVTEEVMGNPTQALQEVLVAKAIYKSVKTKHWEAVTVENAIDSDS